MKDRMAFGILAGWLSLAAGCTPLPLYTALNKDSGSVRDKEQATAVSDAKGVTTGAAAGNLYPGGIPEEKQNALLREIEAWKGTPYKFGIVEKGVGTDCSGFVGYLYRKILGVELPRKSEDMYAAAKPVEEKDLRFGDLVFFQNTYKGAAGASHVGMYLSGGEFAHASTTVGVTVSKLNEDYYVKHFLGYRRAL